MIATLAAVCAQCWVLFHEYFDTVFIVSIWIAIVFRLRIPLSTKRFLLHIGTMVLTLVWSMQDCIFGVDGWWAAPYFSANGAVRGCMLSGSLLLIPILFSGIGRMVHEFRRYSSDRSSRENPGTHNLYQNSDDVMAAEGSDKVS